MDLQCAEGSIVCKQTYLSLLMDLIQCASGLILVCMWTYININLLCRWTSFSVRWTYISMLMNLLQSVVQCIDKLNLVAEILTLGCNICVATSIKNCKQLLMSMSVCFFILLTQRFVRKLASSIISKRYKVEIIKMMLKLQEKK